MATPAPMISATNPSLIP